ncbi:MAG: sulfurtransferase TusA family protein [Chitinispirillaceae bacterium]|nr:sulfurtransferase TusA family protein [Chitinispirillaceae bacterium]
MAEVLNCRGMKCPQPVLKVAIKANTLPAGTVIEVHADCPSFPDDIKKWCNDSGKVLVSIVDNGGFNVATVQL